MTSRKKLADLANAVHEAGHTVSIWTEELLPGVKKVSIVSDPKTGNAGTTVPKHKRTLSVLSSRQLLRARIRTFLAGRIAEELCLGEPFMGAYDDFEMATRLAMILVAQEGMHDGFGPLSLGETAMSEHVRRKVDLAIAKVLAECYREEKARLRRKKQQILKITFALTEQKTLRKRQIKAILGKRPKWRVPIPALKRSKNTKARRK
jgi:cell division protease FtsH